MNRSILTPLAALSTALLLLPTPAPAQQSAVTQWHAHAQTLVAAFTGRGNAAQAYTMALIQVAVYDAAVAVRGADSNRKRPYEPFIADLSAPAGTDLNAAIATAAFRVGYERVNSNPAARANYQSAYGAYIAAIADGRPKVDGIAIGEATAKAVLAARSTDNFYNTAAYTNPAADPGDEAAPLVPTSAALFEPVMQAEIARRVAARVTPAQAELLPSDGPALVEIVARTTALLADYAIDIPRIMVKPKGMQRGHYAPFALDVSKLHVQPVDQQLVSRGARRSEVFDLFTKSRYNIWLSGGFQRLSSRKSSSRRTNSHFRPIGVSFLRCSLAAARLPAEGGQP